MKNYLFLLVLALSITSLAFVPKNNAPAVILIKTCEINITGTSPATDVAAVSKTMAGAINLSTNIFVFKIKMNTFEFDNKSMQDHYNEKYLETEKYTHATFNGTMDKTIDITKNSTTTTNVTGIIDIHGVKKTRTIPVTIKVENKKVKVTSTFNVNLKDHNIEVPSVVFAKIGEDIKVDVVANFE